MLASYSGDILGNFVIEKLEKRFREAAPQAEFATLRFLSERSEQIRVRQNVVQPVTTADDTGAMVTVFDKGGMGYAATSDLSTAGLRDAGKCALKWAHRTAGKSVVDFEKVEREAVNGEYQTPVRKAWDSVSLQDKIGFLRKESERLKTDSRIVDWEAGLWYTEGEMFIVTTAGGRLRQLFRYLVPGMTATANEGAETQLRTLGGHGYARQGGLEILDDVGFFEAAPRLSQQALELLSAPNCPSGKMDVLLAPDQMILQIHESIGHPLELDRILGDERNYAGTSFVTIDMFGKYRYGSDLLNITFDPRLGI